LFNNSLNGFVTGNGFLINLIFFLDGSKFSDDEPDSFSLVTLKKYINNKYVVYVIIAAVVKEYDGKKPM